jgi:hypothetical protein
MYFRVHAARKLPQRRRILSARPENSALSAPVRTTSGRAFCPSTRLSALTRIDLPAPVSPVSTFIPLPSSTSSSSMMAKFLTRRHRSMGHRYHGQGVSVELGVGMGAWFEPAGQ